MLPLHWVDFTGTYQDDKVQLQWLTENELNAREFTVQRSTDGLAWKDIGVVSYMGSATSGSSYRFGFIPESGGVLYVRIKETDYDGRELYRKVISLAIPEAGKSEISNPIKNGIINITILEKGWLKLYNLTGKLCYQEYCLPGAKVINVGQQAAGVYVIVINRNKYKVLIQ